MNNGVFKKYGSTLAPEVISEQLWPVIDELVLEENCHHLAQEGWTVVENV